MNNEDPRMSAQNGIDYAVLRYILFRVCVNVGLPFRGNLARNVSGMMFKAQGSIRYLYVRTSRND